MFYHSFLVIKNFHHKINNKLILMKRIELIRNQLKQSLINFKSSYNPLDKFKSNSKLDKDLLEKVYFPIENHKELRDKIFNIMKNIPEFRIQPYQTEMTSSQMKLLSITQMKLLVKEIGKHIPFREIRNDPFKFGILMECINHYDFGLTVRFSFHFLLYYNSLLILGSEVHKEYIERCISLEDLGCFGLTELGHGSNVKSLKTTAHYDEKTKEFVLHSPNYDAYKWWIGGAGRTANMAIIFAQLYTKNNCHGVHAFLVPIRDKGDHSPYTGVIIGDTGPKAGHEGVDNGFIGFINYRIPRDSLLNKISQVLEDGTFQSDIKNPDVRFANILGALSEGRLGLSLATQVIINIII
jgi:acyl-CoA oxidase